MVKQNITGVCHPMTGTTGSPRPASQCPRAPCPPPNCNVPGKTNEELAEFYHHHIDPHTRLNVRNCLIKYRGANGMLCRHVRSQQSRSRALADLNTSKRLSNVYSVKHHITRAIYWTSCGNRWSEQASIPATSLIGQYCILSPPPQ
jgi:hypothetical protein